MVTLQWDNTCANVVCVLLKEIRQLVSDLPLARLAAHKKPFFHSEVDYHGPLNFAEG